MSSENKIIRQQQLDRYFTKGVVPIRNDLLSLTSRVDAMSDDNISFKMVNGRLHAIIKIEESEGN